MLGTRIEPIPLTPYERNSSMSQRIDNPLICLDEGRGDCAGEIDYREALSATGVRFPRCDNHWEVRLHEQEQINQRYPYHQPSDFDPTYAGERWDDEY